MPARNLLGSVPPTSLRTTALGDAKLISCKSHFLFLSFLRLLGNTSTYTFCCIKQLLLDCLNTNQADKIQSLRYAFL